MKLLKMILFIGGPQDGFECMAQGHRSLRRVLTCSGVIHYQFKVEVCSHALGASKLFCT